MHGALGGCIVLACAAALYGQAQPAQNSAGLAAEWDMGVILNEISAHAARLLPSLDRIDVKSWMAKGASETYAAQLESSKQQAAAMRDEAKALSANPEKLSQLLVLYFRIQGLEEMLESLEGGIRQYAGAQQAAALASQEAENGANRERLRTYIVNLAADRERQFEIMDQEAQRCRAFMAAQPAAPPRKSPGRKK